MNSTELENRKPIWIALSKFYLDNELTCKDFDHMAIIFQKSGLHIKDIKQIDLMKVFPLLQPNLLNISGAWTDFDEDWLLSECIKHYQKRENRFYRLNYKFWNALFYWIRRDGWNQIEQRIINT
ncbi:hypothetical protein IW15_17995 [Chryseobacterium soli]|uniref:DUF7079 domain-containing protein n=1 Tax=Chryseobacterium soli TaxID=445961 RepID=A0A086A2Y8_9FLAO|nr:hypothetical protein [Chryseobacterium soli]KFF11052.1 hypothetical protein IW15_17995 [Chryseobacterium soli]